VRGEGPVVAGRQGDTTAAEPAARDAAREVKAVRTFRLNQRAAETQKKSPGICSSWGVATTSRGGVLQKGNPIGMPWAEDYPEEALGRTATVLQKKKNRGTEKLTKPRRRGVRANSGIVSKANRI